MSSLLNIIGKRHMERELIRLPLLLYFLCLVTGGLTSGCFPILTWVLVPVLFAALGLSIMAAFFTVRYSCYQGTVQALLALFFVFFILMTTQTALESWIPAPGPVLVAGIYFVILAVIYGVRYQTERQTNWHDFKQTFKSPTLAIENGKVKRFGRQTKGERRVGRSGLAANFGAGLGMATTSVVGAVAGARGKELLLWVVVAAFMVTPFLLLRFLVPYSVGIREVMKVERDRAVRLELDNADALQQARRRNFFARLLNSRLRTPV
ncbi:MULTISPECIES: hypothetical protein [unclassified Paraburkholderia]|uniref:hypothetical protein n=1 Tax=unclassified Paraburkholderia TaxID=2615204 RepID=UPI002AB1F245|nr:MULTISPECIES: hypothetical protein [unclassified Paraburkholderia]